MSKTPEELIRELETGGVLGEGARLPARSSGAVVARRERRGSPTLFIILAVMLVALIGSLPVVSLALYPFSLFVTLVHECWHGIVTVATGGSVQSIHINPDLSGTLRSSGGSQPLISSAGYVGAAITGALALTVPLRFARGVIVALAAVPVLALAAFHPATAFTAIWCVLFALGLGAAAWKLNRRLLAFLQVFLATEIALNALRDLATLVLLSAPGSQMQSDATNMSQALFGPSIMWSVLWTILSVLVLAAAVVRVGTEDLRRLTAR